MSLSFVHETLGQRVLLEHGAAHRNLRAEVERLGASRVLVICAEPEAAIADRVCAGLPVALRWDEVKQHVPVENAERARAAAIHAQADALVSVGGGSTTGLAKAVALTLGLPIVAVPTTYAGSEATNVWGMTEGGVKTTGVDPRVLPVSVVYGSELTMSLPADLSVASGLNGLAHCVDSLWAPRADPINEAISLEGARALAEGMPAVVKDPTGIEGRDQCLYGAYLAAVAFASAGSGMHHKICHVLGGAYDLPHAQTHAVVLPYVLAFNAPNAPRQAARLAGALGVPDHDAAPRSAVEALNVLRARLDAPTALRDYGMSEQDIPDAVSRLMGVIPPDNPTPVTRDNLTALLRAAWAGDPPGVDRGSGSGGGRP
jgi:maleylacetate reductase